MVLSCQPEEPDENHRITVKQIEDEYFVHVQHDMGKAHHISFLAALSSNKIQMVRGVVSLPHGTGKVTRVLVLCTQMCIRDRSKSGDSFSYTTRWYSFSHSISSAVSNSLMLSLIHI